MRTTLISFTLLMLCVGTADQEEEKTPFDGLDWLVGGWARVAGETRMEECWLPARGGVMLGLHRDVFSKDRSFFEYLRIGLEGNDLVYYASPLGRKATPFRLKSLSEGKVIFENPDHDFPQRIIYLLKDANTLVARIEGEEEGKEKSSQWEWKRADLFN
jgi:hypothetical protein